MRVVTWCLFLAFLFGVYSVVKNFKNPYRSGGLTGASAPVGRLPDPVLDPALARAAHIPGCAEKGCDDLR